MHEDDDALFAQTNHMLPAQLAIIAKAALAGCKFAIHPGERQIGAGYLGDKKWSRGYAVDCIEVSVWLPNGYYVGRFNDKYEASCIAIGIIEGEVSTAQAEKFEKLKGLFKLRDDNEQR